MYKQALAIAKRHWDVWNAMEALWRKGIPFHIARKALHTVFGFDALGGE